MNNDTNGLSHNSLGVLLIDIIISSFSSIGAILLTRWMEYPIPHFEYYVLAWLGVSIVSSLISFLIQQTHRIVIRYSSYRSVGRFTMAVLIKELLLGGTLYFWSDVNSDKQFMVLLLIFDTLFTLIALILIRVIIIEFLSRESVGDVEKNVSRLAVMVYGVSDKSVAMLTRLEESNHYKVEGFLSRKSSDAGKIINDRRVYYFENEEDIRKLKINVGFECILFSRDSDAEAEKDGLVTTCLHNGIHMLVSPKVEQMDFGGLSQETVRQMNDSDFIPDGMTDMERLVKRVVDLVLSGLLLIVFSPVMLICYIALKIGDKGPAIYKQERIGRFGRPFYIYKFRSMRTDAEAAGPALYSGDDDPRLTKVGAFLRSHHLDEMPQLWNVFKGDMAFVGYRPERKFYIDQIMEKDPRYYYLYQIRPGVTSYATLRNGYTDSMEKMLRRLEFDLYYLRHRSWWFDAKVLWFTFSNIVFGKKF